MFILEQDTCFKIISFNITGEEYICMNVKAVRILLDMVQYLRQQTRPKQGYVIIRLVTILHLIVFSPRVGAAEIQGELQ